MEQEKDLNLDKLSDFILKKNDEYLTPEGAVAFIGKRRSGKTRKLIIEAFKNGSHIVCSTMNEAEQIKRDARELGYDIKDPITFNDFIARKFFGKGIRSLCIDNVDTLLRYMCQGLKLQAFSLQIDEKTDFIDDTDESDQRNISG